ETGHPHLFEGHVIRTAHRARVDLLEAQVPKRFDFRIEDRLEFFAALQPEADDVACARVVCQANRRARHLILVLFDIGLGAIQALFFARNETKTNGALRLHAAPGKDARGLQNYARARTIIGRALGQVPGIEMGADDDEFFGLVTAAKLSDRVVDGDGPRDQLVVDLQLDAR